MPAAAVIPAPTVYIQIVAVEMFVVKSPLGFRVVGSLLLFAIGLGAMALARDWSATALCK